jgi:predicted DsbA family dithiol-disulfide isomerase
MDAMRQPLRVPVYYDFASTLCYVAHRVSGRLHADLEELGIDFRWTPLDLASLLGIQRGAEILPARRANAARVARELEVAVSVPRLWMDSRPALTMAVALSDSPRAATWRERVWSEVYEAGRSLAAEDAVAALAQDLGLVVSAAELESAGRELERSTFEASSAMVTGVPTFMLGEWAFGGIQEEATMRAVLRRFAERRRSGQM